MLAANEPAQVEAPIPILGAASFLMADAIALFESLELPVIATDVDSVVTFWNRGACDLFGWSTDEAVGQPSGDLLGGAHADWTVESMVPGGAHRSGHLPVRRIDGATVIARSTSSAVHDDNGEIVGLIVLFSEVFLSVHDAGEAPLPAIGSSALRPGGPPVVAPRLEPQDDRISVVLATDSLLIGDGLASLFAAGTDVNVIGRARGHLELLGMCRTLAPQAVIISIRSADDTSMATVTGARHLREECPDMGIVLISDCGSGFVLELLRDGSSRLAYLLDDQLPSMETVVGALRDVVAGQSALDPSIVDFLVKHHRVSIDDLSHREADVLELMAEGLSNRAIADQLNISVKSIEKCITAIFRNLDLNDQSRVDRRVTATLNFQRSKSIGLEYDGPERRVAERLDSH